MRLLREQSRLAALLLALMTVTAAVANTASAAAKPPEQKPNFVVIFIDDMGYGDIGPFGSTVNRTPNLDRMAAEGMKLTSFYVAAPVCTPSRAALMTGSYPKRVGLATGSRHGVLFPADPWGLHPDEVTIAELLKAEEYATGCFGKWHLGDQPEFLPNAQGFDEYFGVPYSNDMWPMHPNTSRGGMWDFPPLPLVRNSEVVGRVENMQDQAMLCKQFTDEAVKFIRRNRNRPFFVYLPHAFIHHPRAARKSFLSKAGLGSGVVDWSAVLKDPWGVLVEQRTRAQIEEVDWSVGEVLNALRELDLAKDTLVIFTSDNGGSRGCSNAPLRGGKGSTWEGGMREPALAWWPGRVPAAAVCAEMATAMDLLPTFAKLSGGRVPGDRVIDGKDISPLLLGRPGARSPHQAFYYYKGQELQAVRSGKWKLMAGSGALYNLDEDIGETTDVAARRPKVVVRLKQYLADARADLGDGQESCPRCRPVGVADNPEFLLPRSARTETKAETAYRKVPLRHEMRLNSSRAEALRHGR